MAVMHSATWSPGAGKPAKGAKGVDDKLPTEKEMAKAGEVEVFDQESREQTFSSFFTAHEGVQHKYLVIFIRHFFCGICQEYIRRLSKDLPPSSLPSDTSIIIIGCGQPLHLARYITETESAYPIYASPSKKLHQIFRMTRTLDLGSQHPDYLSHTSMTRITLRSLWQELKSGRQMLSGGDYSQVGGEFLFEVDAKGKVQPVWCKRMRTTRDHTELGEIQRVIGMSPAKEVDNESSDSASPAPVASAETSGSIAPSTEKRKRWSSFGGASGGIGRKLSKRSRTRSWQVGSSGHNPSTDSSAMNIASQDGAKTNGGPVEKIASTGTAASASSREALQEREVLEQLREEPEGQKQEGRDDALAKLSNAKSALATAAENQGQAEDVPAAVVNTTEGDQSGGELLNGVAAVKEEKRSALMPDITTYQKPSSVEPEVQPPAVTT